MWLVTVGILQIYKWPCPVPYCWRTCSSPQIRCSPPAEYSWSSNQDENQGSSLPTTHPNDGTPYHNTPERPHPLIPSNNDWKPSSSPSPTRNSMNPSVGIRKRPADDYLPHHPMDSLLKALYQPRQRAPLGADGSDLSFSSPPLLPGDIDLTTWHM